MQSRAGRQGAWCGALLALLCAGSALAAGGSARAARIDQLMRGYHGAVPGAAVLVLRDGRPLFRRAYGNADLEAQRPVSPATNFRLASMTKQFTAAAVLLLAQEGRLSLDDPVRRWLPSLPPATDAVRVRDLLTHVSGVIDYEELIPAGTTRQLHDADVLRLLEAENRTYFTPASQYRYSDSGYALLSLIVARAARQPFAAFLRERIFAPLGMQGSVAYEAGVSQVRERAVGYRAAAGRWQRDDQSLTSAVLGDGGIYSSIADLARWDAALYDARLLSDATRAQAFTPWVSTEDPHVQYGFGWRITGETLWHSGETVGFRNVIVRWPRRHFTVIVLTNRDAPEPYDTALAIARLYFPDADAVRAAQVVVGPDSGAHPLPQTH
jgi:CubicO group peptidase (beta-lactamase class C family)